MGYRRIGVALTERGIIDQRHQSVSKKSFETTSVVDRRSKDDE